MPRLCARVLQHGKNHTTVGQAESDLRHGSLGRMVLAIGLTVVILAACGDDDATDSSTTSSNSSTTTQAESEADLTGTWVGTWAIDPPYAGAVGEFTMELVQTGGSFNGTVAITNTDCSNGTVSGTVVGTTVNFGWILTPQPVQFTGVLDGASMSGTWASIACSDPNISLTGTWEATKS